MNKNFPFLINLSIFYLLVSAFGTVIINIFKSGISSLFDIQNYTPSIIQWLLPNQTSIRYVAFGYSLLIFGTYLLILYIRYNIYALPMFLISYTIWDLLGIISYFNRGGATLYENGGWYLPYIPFELIAYISFGIAVVMYKYKLLSFNWNFKLFIVWFLLNETVFFKFFLDIWAIHPTLIAIIQYIPILLFTYSSIKPVKQFPTFEDRFKNLILKYFGNDNVDKGIYEEGYDP